METEDDAAVAQRRGGAVGLEGRQAEKADLDAAFADGTALFYGALDQRDERRARRQGRHEATFGQEAEALAEQGFGRLVHRDERAVRADHHGRFGAEIEGRGLHAIGVAPRCRGLGLAVHAANLF